MVGADESPEVVEMSVCESCGKMVPFNNLELHEARACPNRKLPARRTTQNAPVMNNEASVSMTPASGFAATATAPLEIYDTDTDDSVLYCSPPTSPSVAQSATSMQPLPALTTASTEPPIVDGYEVIERPLEAPQHENSSFMNNDVSTTTTSPGSPWRRITSGISNAFCQGSSPSMASAAADRSASPPTLPYPGARRRRTADHRLAIDLTRDDTQNDTAADNMWACPRCTLLNNNRHSTCEACHYSKNGSKNNLRRGSDFFPSGVTTQTSARSRHSHGYNQPSPARTTQNVAIGGALFGGVIGAASAFARGRPVAGAALDGALNGAIGSVVLNDIAQQVERSGTSQSHASRRQAVDNASRRRRDLERIDDLLALSLMEQEMNQALRTTGRRPGYATRDPTHRYMMATGRMPPYGHVDVSRMSYEELLARFGDGSENRGASAAQLSQLPVQTIEDVSQLGGECKDCSICLDEFKAGDKRKTLPCLHGFHEGCANKWLSTNASCPICKHRVTD